MIYNSNSDRLKYTHGYVCAPADGPSEIELLQNWIIATCGDQFQALIFVETHAAGFRTVTQRALDGATRDLLAAFNNLPRSHGVRVVTILLGPDADTSGALWVLRQLERAAKRSGFRLSGFYGAETASDMLSHIQEATA